MSDPDRRLARLIAIARDAMPRGGALSFGEPFFTSGKTRGTGLVDFTFP